jgi:hypothetical protein
LSYDIEFLRLSGSGNLLAQVHQARDAAIRLEEEAGSRQEALPEPIPSTSAQEDERRAKLVADLVALHPSLYSAPFSTGPSYGFVVDTHDPHQCPVPYIAVGPYIGMGIDGASTSFPYSADFQLVLPELKRVIEVFERHGYTAYDRQIDAVVTASSSFLDTNSSFVTTRDEVVGQMLARGERVIGYPIQRNPHLAVAGAVIVLAAAIALVLLRQHYATELPPSVKKELRDLQDRTKRP